MWQGLNPNSWPEFAFLREMVALQHQAPRNEWPLIRMEEYDVFLVVREWPNGSLTAYTIETPRT